MARIVPRRRRIGPLDCLEVINKEGAPTVVLFHGFGADNSDLASLAGAVAAPKDTNWIFPNGHLTVPIGPHYEGRAWFPISMRDLEAAQTTGVPIDFTTLTPPGLKKARYNVMEMLQALKLPWDRIVLGGFSQGAMLATEVTLEANQAPASLALLSSTLIDSVRWSQLAPKRAGLSFFQSHGKHDPVLPLTAAEKLERVLIDGGLKGKLYKFEGQHAIPPDVLIRLGDHLRTVLQPLR